MTKVAASKARVSVVLISMVCESTPLYALGIQSGKCYSKTCVKRPLIKRPKIGFKTNDRLMQVKSIAECSKGSILQYF